VHSQTGQTVEDAPGGPEGGCMPQENPGQGRAIPGLEQHPTIPGPEMLPRLMLKPDGKRSQEYDEEIGLAY